MRSKIVVSASFVVMTLILTGCGGSRAAMGPEETNILGIVKHQKADYSYTGPTTIAVHTNELTSRRDYSGNKTSVLWGLFTLKDY